MFKTCCSWLLVRHHGNQPQVFAQVVAAVTAAQFKDSRASCETLLRVLTRICLRSVDAGGSTCSWSHLARPRLPTHVFVSPVARQDLLSLSVCSPPLKELSAGPCCRPRVLRSTTETTESWLGPVTEEAFLLVSPLPPPPVQVCEDSVQKVPGSVLHPHSFWYAHWRGS